MQPSDFTSDFPGRLEPLAQLGVVGYIPNDLSEDLDLSPQVMQMHEEAVLALGALGAVIPRLPSPGLVTSPFLTREAVLSSRIEGTRTEVDQLYLFDVDEATAESADESTEAVADAIEVRNYIHALRYGLEQIKTRPVHARLLREMHEILLKGVRGEDKAPGYYRWKQAFLGSKLIESARFVAAPADKVDELMNRLELFINLENRRMPSLVRIACIHYQFEAIHPFNDGNGRLGRLLISLLLSTHGLLSEPFLYLSAYLERYRADYANHLREVSRCGDWESWILFFLDGVIHEAKDAATRARNMLDLREDMRIKLQKTQGSAKALELADYLFKTPAVSVPIVAEHILHMSYGGADKVIKKLMKVGLLREATSRRRNRVFIAQPIIDLLKVDIAISSAPPPQTARANDESPH